MLLGFEHTPQAQAEPGEMRRQQACVVYHDRSAQVGSQCRVSSPSTASVAREVGVDRWTNAAKKATWQLGCARCSQRDRKAVGRLL
jgi:hypothetical protein